jgi:ammonia channel protein AmtB
VASVVLPKEGGFMTGSANAASAVRGALVGTVAMASGAALQEPEWAVLSNVCSCAVVYLIDWLTAKVDVAGFDCFMTHAVGGFVGSAMTGLFANNLNNRLYKLATLPQGYAGAFFGGGGKQLAYQCAGISVTILLTVVMTIGIYALVHVVMIPFGGAWEEKEGEEGPPPLKAAAAEAADAARA